MEAVLNVVPSSFTGGILSRIRKALKGRGGFSLAEMAIAMVVLAIIIGVVYLGAKTIIDNSKVAASSQQLEAIKGASISYFAKYNGYPSDLAGTTSPGIKAYLPTIPGSGWVYSCAPAGGVKITHTLPDATMATAVKDEWEKQLGSGNVQVVAPADVEGILGRAPVTCATN